jgi:SAM-dependent methyltransferase
MRNDLASYVEDISEFLELPPAEVEERLLKGFHWNHAEVAADFRRVDPKTDDELLQWYMTTTAYLYAELPAYHLDSGFNYFGGVEGYVNRLKAEGKKDVLVLGDGIGDLTMELHHAGFNVSYHDLKGSQTSEFALYRFWKAYGNEGPKTFWTDGWTFDLGDRTWDAIVATDVFEHLVDVEGVARSVARGLRPGGLFAAQNAFGIGDDEHEGTIPCHLVINNEWVERWAPFVSDLGFKQTGDVWYAKTS